MSRNDTVVKLVILSIFQPGCKNLKSKLLFFSAIQMANYTRKARCRWLYFYKTNIKFLYKYYYWNFARLVSTTIKPAHPQFLRWLWALLVSIFCNFRKKAYIFKTRKFSHQGGDNWPGCSLLGCAQIRCVLSVVH